MCYSILVEQDLKVLSLKFGATPVRSQFDHYERLCDGDPRHFKRLSGHARIYPNYFAPVAVSRQGQIWSLPMRYRVRPAGSTEEIPSKYNVFNARLDSLTNRRTWSHLIGRQHGLILIREFYEWVEDPSNKRKKVVSFKPDTDRVIAAPVLWDWWESEDKIRSFFSFAVITTDPPAQILAAGHDRCPVFLPENRFASWLNPEESPMAAQMDILRDSFTCNWIVQEAKP